MRKRVRLQVLARWRVIVCIVLVGTAFGCRLHRERGRPAPAFQLKSPEGEVLDSASLRGKVALVNFWASWCPPCLKEMPMFQKVYQMYRDRGFTIVGISMDRSAKIARRYAADLKVAYPIVMGTDKVSDEYKVNGLPTTFLLDKKGKIRQYYIGPPMLEQLKADIERLL